MIPEYSHVVLMFCAVIQSELCNEKQSDSVTVLPRRRLRGGRGGPDVGEPDAATGAFLLGSASPAHNVLTELKRRFIQHQPIFHCPQECRPFFPLLRHCFCPSNIESVAEPFALLCTTIITH